MLKSSRHAKILELITHQEIETQEELCEQLKNANFVVTQATVSRDIRDLHLFKVAGVEKKYRYAYINEPKGEITAKMKSLFHDCVLSVKIAQNIVVVKTLTANAANAGTVIDKLCFEDVLGSVAGDDTLIIVCSNNDAAKRVSDKVFEFLK